MIYKKGNNSTRINCKHTLHVPQRQISTKNIYRSQPGHIITAIQSSASAHVGYVESSSVTS
jgi:hypothetical protein